MNTMRERIDRQRPDEKCREGRAVGWAGFRALGCSCGCVRTMALALARLHICVPELPPSTTGPSASKDPTVFVFATKAGNDVC